MTVGATFVLLALLAATAAPPPAPQQPAPMACETGPVSRAFGGTQWLVYSCADQASMVVVSAQGNPASPFVFILSPANGQYRVRGEGNGDRKASQAAGDALSKLTAAELADLLAATKAGKR